MSQEKTNAHKVGQEEFACIFALGANFFNQGQFKKAQVIFAGLMALDAQSEKASIAYGESLLMGGQVRKALHHFLRAKKRFKSPSIEASLAKASTLISLIRPV